MITSKWKDRELSKLMLGTVQFGISYGVANRIGQPTYRDVVKILAAAIEGGVNCLDTASAYGTSEEVLGRAVQELGVADRVTIVTKLQPLGPEELADPHRAAQVMAQSIEQSRRRLQLDSLPLVLFHREADASHRDLLQPLKERGWVGEVGVSCAHQPGPPENFVQSGTVAALQLPGNLLDRRHEKSGIFQTAASRDVAIFIRSVYLQGLLVMPDDQIPAGLQEVIPVRRRLAALASEAGIDLSELCLRYLLSHDAVTCLLIGVETEDQIRENLVKFNRGPLPADLQVALETEEFSLSEVTITPALWPAR